MLANSNKYSTHYIIVSKNPFVYVLSQDADFCRSKIGNRGQKIRPYGIPKRVENIKMSRFDDVARRKRPNLPKIPPLAVA
jgi:hypothetical protein